MTPKVKTHLISFCTGLLGFYAGMNAVIPASVAIAIYLLSKKTQRLPKDPAYLTVISILLGYGAWALAGGIMAHQPSALVDVIISAALAAWLWFGPGFWSFALTAGFAALGLLGNVHDILQAEFATPLHRALFTHIALRTSELAIVSWAFWHQYKRDRKAEQALLDQIQRASTAN